MKHYEALQDLPGNIRKGDTITTERGVTKNIIGVPVSYKPAEEPNFFKYFVPMKSLYQKGDLVMTRNIVKVACDTKTNNTGWKRSYKTVPAFSPLRVESMSEKKVGNKTNIMYKLVTTKTNSVIHLELIESYITPYVVYFFISSKGVVQTIAIGQEVEVDAFRKAAGNYFATNEEATAKRLAILELVYYAGCVLT